MLTYFKDFATANVSTGYDAAAVAIDLAAGQGANLPPSPFFAFWWNVTDYQTPDLDPSRELVYVGTRTGDALTNLLRGQGDDAASAKNTGGKTYRLLATVSAKEVESRSRQVGSIGPSGNYTAGTPSVEYYTTENIVLPPNFLKAGDLLEWRMFWDHNAGAYAYAPRIGLKLLVGGGSSVYPIGLAAHWSNTEQTWAGEGAVAIRSTSSASMQYKNMRENGSIGCGGQFATIDTTAVMTFQPCYRFDSSGETIRLARLSLVLHRL